MLFTFEEHQYIVDYRRYANDILVFFKRKEYLLQKVLSETNISPYFFPDYFDQYIVRRSLKIVKVELNFNQKGNNSIEI